MNRHTNPKHIILSIVFILGTISLLVTSLDIWRSGRRVDITRNEIGAMEKQKTDLEKSIAYKQTSNYIEDKARTELNMAKPGESIFVVEGLPGDPQKNGVQTPGSVILPAKTLEERMRNLTLWWNLFF